MLAISFALAIALHGGPYMQSATSVAPLGSIPHDVQGPILLPYGQALGTYDIGHGKLLALLEDASGVPLWVLDAEVYESGGIDGDLLPLQYSTNPAQSLGNLSVSGQMLLDESGNGSFFATVFQFGGGAIPVFPVAMIEGTVKQAALGHTIPPDNFRNRLIASVTDPDVYAAPVVRGGVIVCPKAFDPELAGVQSVGSMAQGGFAKTGSGTQMIVDPAVATTGGAGQASVGAKRERAAAGHQLLLGPSLARVQLRWWLL
jgi:hypothetical protein